MTKKDFELIASVVLETGSDGALCMDSAADRVSLAHNFAIALQKAEPRFDYERFINAATDEEDRLEASQEYDPTCAMCERGEDPGHTH